MSKEFINLTKLGKKNYDEYYLLRNPFPTSSVPEEVPPFTADREKEKQHFRDMMSDLIVENRSSVTVFVGDYGSGKSHLMRALRHAIEQQLFNFEQGVFPVYVRSPGRNFQDFYQEFIENVKRENLEYFAEKVITDYIIKYRDKLNKFIFDDELKKEKNVEKDIKKLLEGSMVTDLFKDIIVKEFGMLKNYDVLYALLYSAHPSFSTYSWRWFLGTKLSRQELDYIKVKSNIDHPRVANTVLNDFITILKQIGIKHVVLLVDELERITFLPSNLRSVYQDDLRHLIDDFPTNMLMVFAIAPYQWQELTKENTALVRRLIDNVFSLEFFTKGQTEQLLSMYLQYSRTDNFPKTDKIKKCKASLYPFTDESIEEIFVLTGGVSSRILKICRKAIDELVKNKIDVVKADLVQKIAQE